MRLDVMRMNKAAKDSWIWVSSLALFIGLFIIASVYQSHTVLSVAAIAWMVSVVGFIVNSINTSRLTNIVEMNTQRLYERMYGKDVP